MAQPEEPLGQLDFRQQLALARYEQVMQAVVARGNGVLELGITGIRSLVIIHGGALIGLFSLLGNAQNPTLHVSAQGIFAAAGAFVFGLVFALLNIFLVIRYEGQQIQIMLDEAEREALAGLEGQPPPKRPPVTRAAGALGLLSVVLFIVGALAALWAVVGAPI